MTKQFAALISEFSETALGKQLADPEAAEGKCIVASEKFVEFCRKRGVMADVVYLSGAENIAHNPAFASNRLRTFFDDKETPPHARIPMEHAVVRLANNCFVDWTARQFDSRAHHPLVAKKLPQWNRVCEWPLHKNNLFKALDDVAMAVHEEDEEFFEGGCGDVAKLMEKVLEQHGVPSQRRAGYWGRGTTHVWLDVEGTFYDPVARTMGAVYGDPIINLTPAATLAKEAAIIELHTMEDGGEDSYEDELIKKALAGKRGEALREAACALIKANGNVTLGGRGRAAEKTLSEKKIAVK